MNREIKFRGKVVHHDSMTNPDDGWVYGFYDQDLYNGEIKHYIISCPMIWRVIPETVSQYTGLKDKNGNEIWEGDIFKEDSSGIVRSVFRVPGGLAFEDNPVSFGYDHRAPVYPYSPIAEMQNASWLSQSCEIIGNIHDNPELLKTE